jgi:hypothetical protein
MEKMNFISAPRKLVIQCWKRIAIVGGYIIKNNVALINRYKT